MRKRDLGAPAVGAVLVTSLLVAGCTAVVHGAAVSGPATSPPGAVDVSLLDVGHYPTRPRRPLGVAEQSSKGSLLDAQRMASNVVGPWEVDSGINTIYGLGALVLTNSGLVASVAPAEVAAAAGRHSFINGFLSQRTAVGNKVLANAVLRFADPASAAAAADEMGDAALQEKVITPPVQRAPIPAHPESVATAYTVIERATGRHWAAVRSFTAHGPYVLLQVAQSTEGRDAAARLIAKTIDLQGPLIDQFTPTHPAHFADVPTDPTGLLARTLPLTDQDATLVENATYDRRGALHFQDDPVRWSPLLDHTGVDTVSVARTRIYQANDAAGAERIVAEFTQAMQKQAKGRPDPVNFMPASRCLQLPDQAILPVARDATHFWCIAPADRYVIETTSGQLRDVHQQVAAQYVMLMAR